MGSFTIQRPAARRLRLAVQMGASHTKSELDAFHKELAQLVKKHNLKVARKRPKK